MPKQFKKRELDVSCLETAQERISRLYDLYDQVIVFFSGGKDSTVLLHLATEEAERRGVPPPIAIFFDEEAIPYETENYVRELVKDGYPIKWLCVPVQHRNACTSDEQGIWWPWAPESKDKWCRPLPPEAITDLPGIDWTDQKQRITMPNINPYIAAEYSSPSARTVILLGLRADESLRRTTIMLSKAVDNFITQLTPTLSTAYPIYDFRTPDIWTMIKREGWKYNHAYDLMEMLGIPQSRQRCAPPYGEQPMKNLVNFKACFPDIWDKVAGRVPGAATAGIYATTQLYGIGKEDDLKREDQTWQDAINEALLLLPSDIAPITKKRIKRELARHHKKTNGLPVLDVPHPDSGVSWPFLLRLAKRGDSKGRITAIYPQDDKQRKVMTSRYEEALGGHA